MSFVSAASPLALTLALASATLPAQAAPQTISLDLEGAWSDLALNTFVQINTLTPLPADLHWGEAWFGQTSSPLLGSNNELRLGTGSSIVDNSNRPFYLDAVDFRSMANGGSIQFDLVLQTYDALSANGAGIQVVYSLKIDGAPDVVAPPLLFTTFTDTAQLGPLHSFSFANFKAGGQTTARNLFVMDNLQLRMEAAAPVPEPGSMLLMALGLVALVASRSRRGAQA
jgi:hypothetical protein